MGESSQDRIRRMAADAATRAKAAPKAGPRTEMVVVVYELDTETGEAKTAGMMTSLPMRNRKLERNLAVRLRDVIDRKLEGVVFEDYWC